MNVKLFFKEYKPIIKQQGLAITTPMVAERQVISIRSIGEMGVILPNGVLIPEEDLDVVINQLVAIQKQLRVDRIVAKLTV